MISVSTSTYPVQNHRCQMSKKIQELFQQLPPFMMLGVGIAFFIALMIMFFYVLIWGAIIGGIIWVGFVIKNALFPKKEKTESSGRIIEHDDQK